MNNDLQNRASKNFNRYLNDFLQTGKSAGLPEGRLSKQEWEELNKLLSKSGVVLSLRKHTNGGMYYWFEHLDKTKNFKQGTENIFNVLLEKIRNKYPNLSDVTIIEMIKSGGNNVDSIYEKLRYKQDGEYTDVSQKDFEDTFEYALMSAGNKSELFNYAFRHNWNAEKYKNTNIAVLSVRGKNWPDDRKIKMYGTQHWTWFRQCDGNVLPPIKDAEHPKGFHISANVRVTDKLLQVLDDILIADGGKYIHAYKFPKTEYYFEIKKRHDPVTIYLNARNPELERQISKALQPFVRSNDGLVGEMIGGGISISPETSTADGGISVGTAVAKDIANLIKTYSGARA